MDQPLHLNCLDLDALPLVVSRLLSHVAALGPSAPTVWLLDAEMGAGKTTLIREICRQRGSTDRVGSPTFALIHEYADGRDAPLYHFDFYRIDDEAEAAALGTTEYFDSGYLCLVEWPSRVPSLWPEAYVRITIETMPNGTRRLTLTHVHEDN